MYQTVLLILILLVLIPALTHLIRYREYAMSRRLSAGLGIVGLLICPYAAGLLCQVLRSLFHVGLLVAIVLFGIGLMIKSLFVRHR